MNRRGFLGLLGGAALIVPELLLPKRTFFLPPVGGWGQYTNYALGYTVTYEELADGLYEFGLAQVKREGARIIYDTPLSIWTPVRRLAHDHYE